MRPRLGRLLGLSLSGVAVMAGLTLWFKAAERGAAVDALTSASVEGNVAEVDRLLDAGAPATGWALMMAADKGHSKVVARLLEGGADPNTTHEKGATTLGWAAAGGHVDTMEVLIGAGAAVNLRAPESGRSPLMAAAGAGEVEALRLLLQHGADVNARSEMGSTALMAVAETTDPALYPRARRCAALLLAHGADARFRDTEGRTANDYALLSDHPALAALLTSRPNPEPCSGGFHYAGIRIQRRVEKHAWPQRRRSHDAHPTSAGNLCYAALPSLYLRDAAGAPVWGCDTPSGGSAGRRQPEARGP